MAEAFLRKYGGDVFEAHSAGLEPKGVHPFTERVMEEIGVSFSNQYSKHIKEYIGKAHFGYLIIVCDEAERTCPTTFPGLGRRLHWSFEDPAAFEGSEEDKLAKFREVRDQIEQRIKDWLAEQNPTKGGYVMRLRRLLLVCIFAMSIFLIIWVFVMFRTTYRYSSEGCGVTGCGVPKQCIRPSIWEELINWVGGTQYMR